MKKIKLPLLLSLAALLATLVWFSCAKEKIQPHHNNSTSQSGSGESVSADAIDTCALLISQITMNANGMLSFSDATHFNKVVICLETRVDNYNDDFEAAHPNTTDEEIEAIIDSLGWNEDQPLLDVEAGLGFMSLRRSIESQMDIWLNNSVLDPSTNPDDHIITDEETRSLLTPDCKAMIGGQVIDFCTPPSGNTLEGGEVSDRSISACSLVDGGCCWWGKDKANFYYDNDTKQYFVYVTLRTNISGFPNYAYVSQAKGKVLSCKRENGKWKRYRTNLRVGIGGRTWGDWECPVNGNDMGGDNFSKSKPANFSTKRKKKIRVSTHSWFQGKRYARSGDISAIGWVGSSMQETNAAFLNF